MKQLPPIVQLGQRIGGDQGLHRGDIEDEHQYRAAETEDRRFRQDQYLEQAADDDHQREQPDKQMLLSFVGVLDGDRPFHGVAEDGDDIDDGYRDQEHAVQRLRLQGAVQKSMSGATRYLTTSVSVERIKGVMTAILWERESRFGVRSTAITYLSQV